MSKRFLGVLISILTMLLTFFMNSASVQAGPAVIEGLASFEAETREIDDVIAYAQEDPEAYPGQEPENEEAEGFPDTTTVETNNDLETPLVNGENPDGLEITGDEQYPAEGQRSESDFEIQMLESTDPTDGLAGKIYLWVAFIAAIVIFTAAILGAILLYTRQRSQE